MSPEALILQPKVTEVRGALAWESLLLSVSVCLLLTALEEPDPGAPEVHN